MVIIYPLRIFLLFNKVTPLHDGELRERLRQLAKTTQFPINKTFTMDGNKRSAHSNTFFTSLEQFSHIMLYETLTEQIITEEIVAIFTYEIGHYEHQYIHAHLIVEGVCNFLGFGILSWLSCNPLCYKSFEFQMEHTLMLLILIFSIAISGTTYLIDTFSNAFRADMNMKQITWPYMF
jgi:STE24 endopeptidase